MLKYPLHSFSLLPSGLCDQHNKNTEINDLCTIQNVKYCIMPFYAQTKNHRLDNNKNDTAYFIYV